MTPVQAVRTLLARVGWSLADVDLVELNEAFAVQAIAVVRELGLDDSRVNVNGGAVALGLRVAVHQLEARRLQPGMVRRRRQGLAGRDALAQARQVGLPDEPQHRPVGGGRREQHRGAVAAGRVHNAPGEARLETRLPFKRFNRHAARLQRAPPHAHIVQAAHVTNRQLRRRCEAVCGAARGFCRRFLDGRRPKCWAR